MSTIPDRQNEPESLKKLAAQRQFYSEAKFLYGLQLFAAGPLAVVLALTATIEPEAKKFAALWSIILLVVNTLIITPLIKKWRTSGATIQEMFDCYVLQIPWSTIKTGNPIDAEMIAMKAEKLKKRNSKMPTLNDWYSLEVQHLTIDLARTVCQRTNCWWDGHQRRRYASVIAGTSIGLTIALITFALVMQLSLAELLVAVLIPVLPLLTLATTQYVEQIDALSKLDSLKTHCEKAWANSLSNGGAGNVNDARAIQDEIYEMRKRSPLVFDFIFKRIRSSNEYLMNVGVADFVKQAREKGLA